MDTNKLKNCIKERKFTIEFIAKEIGMTRVGLTQSLTNDSLRVVDLEKICKVLQVDIKTFFTENTITPKIDEVYVPLRGTPINPPNLLATYRPPVSVFIPVKELEDMKSKILKMEHEVETLYKVIREMHKISDSNIASKIDDNPPLDYVI